MLSAKHSGTPVKVRVGRVIIIFKPFNLYLVNDDYKGCPFSNEIQTPFVNWYMADNIERDLLQFNATLYCSCTKLNKVFSEHSYTVIKIVCLNLLVNFQWEEKLGLQSLLEVMEFFKTHACKPLYHDLLWCCGLKVLPWQKKTPQSCHILVLAWSSLGRMNSQTF